MVGSVDVTHKLFLAKNVFPAMLTTALRRILSGQCSYSRTPQSIVCYYHNIYYYYYSYETQ